MNKRLQQSKVSATLDDDKVEPVVTSVQVETQPNSCTSSSTPSFNTTHTQLLFTTVKDLSPKGEKPRQVDILVLTGIFNSPG